MKLKKPVNENYSATVVKIKNIIPLDNCDNVVHSNIMGNLVITSKDTKIGDIGIYFPVETQLSDIYCKMNNLYRHSDLNLDKDKKGYIEDNRRIKAVKFRGHESQGLFMPISSVNPFLAEGDILKEGNEFDYLHDTEICRKYVIKRRNPQGSMGRAKKSKESKIVENQFRFHQDTNMLYKHLDRFNPDTPISITYKIHGTSGISSKVLCKKKLNLWDKIGSFLGFNIINAEYDNIFSSRKVIKNDELNPNANHFYGDNIWGIANATVKDYLTNGMTIYYEIAGYLPNGSIIQKDYDYGFTSPDVVKDKEGIPSVGYKEGVNYGIFIYRITYTNSEGKIFEFSARQVQNWCIKNGLRPVPELFYGRADEVFADKRITLDNWRSGFLEKIKFDYNEKNCYLCKSKVPEEGVVVRIEQPDFEAYKAKSAKFYLRETKLLDKGEQDIEEIN